MVASAKQTLILNEFYFRQPINIWQYFVMPEMMQKRATIAHFFKPPRTLRFSLSTLYNLCDLCASLVHFVVKNSRLTTKDPKIFAKYTIKPL